MDLKGQSFCVEAFGPNPAISDSENIQFLWPVDWPLVTVEGLTTDRHPDVLGAL